MTLLHIFTTALLFTTSLGAPAKTTAIQEDKATVIYTSEYDVIDILFPLNGINLDEEEEANGRSNTIEDPEDKALKENKTEIDSVGDKNKEKSPTIFFILADTSNNQTVYKGLYVRKRGKVTKLLDNAKAMSAELVKDVKTVYFATEDGVYSYNAKENKAEKFGKVSEEFIDIAKCKDADVIYVLNKHHVLYKLKELGTKMDLVSDVVGADKIMMDNDNNLFYIKDKEMYVFNGHEVKKIEGVPLSYEYIKMIRAPYVLESGVPLIIDDNIFIAYINGTIKDSGERLSLRTTAFSIEGMFLFYFGHDKKIYEYNFITHLINSMFDKLQQFVGSIFNGLRSFVFGVE